MQATTGQMITNKELPKNIMRRDSIKNSAKQQFFERKKLNNQLVEPQSAIIKEHFESSMTKEVNSPLHKTMTKDLLE